MNIEQCEFIMGLDASKLHTGYVVFDINGNVFANGVIEPNKKWENIESLVYIKKELKAVFEQFKPAIFLENYAFGAHSSSVTSLAEVGGVIKVLAKEAIPSLPVFLVASSSWKKFLLKGTLEKDMIPLEVMSKYKWKAKSTHEADAYVLGRLGLAYVDVKIKSYTDVYSARQIECVNMLKEEK